MCFKSRGYLCLCHRIATVVDLVVDSSKQGFAFSKRVKEATGEAGALSYKRIKP